MMRLKIVTASDYEFILRLRNNHKVLEWTMNNIVTRIGLQNLLYNDGCKMWIIQVDNFSVGTIGYMNHNLHHATAKWHLRIHPNEWRKGYAAKAIKLFLEYIFHPKSGTNINKLMGDCFAENIAEVNLLTKLGFVNEGTWREHYFHRGKFRDSIQFTMLKSDYDKQTAQGNLLVDNS